MIRTLDSNGLLLSSTEHMIGLGAHGTGSSNATHPAAIFGPGGRPAGNVIVAERVVQGATIHTYWRCEDQLNSCIGQIDENGWRAFQNSYLAFGEALQSRVLFDGAMARWSSIDTDTPGPGQSTITLDDSITLTADSLNGALLYLARPGEAVDRHMETNVVDTTSGTIIIDDPSGDFAAALAEATGDPSHFAPPINDFVIFAFNDSKVPNAPTYQTQGTWTTGPTTGSGKTKFTDAEADDNGGGFASWMVGCLLVPDVNIGAPLVIVNVSSATEVEVSGTATGVGSNGSRYLIYAAPFTDPVHGTLQTDAHKTGTRYLWAGYRYQPPQIGFWVNPGAGFGVYGAATGSNRLGQYYCFNRVYDIAIGRWTTPDPVATPWWNLADYVSNNPLQYLDSTGNDGGITAALLEALGAALKKLAVKTAKCIGAAIAAAATAVITVNVFLPGEDPCQIGCMAGIATFAACIFPGGSGLVIGVILDTLLGNPTEDFCKDLCKKIRTSGSTGPSAPAPSPSSTPRRVAHGISDGKTACASEEEMNGRSRPKPPADPSADPEGQRRYERERDEYDKEEKKKAEEEERLKKQREADRKPVKSGMA